jgi:hypothetical protein
MPATAKTSPDPLHDILLEEGMFHGTTDNDLAAAFQNLEQQQSNHLCVFFHGGLVDEGSGLGSAHRLARGYGQAGAYPFFFIWHSGLLDTLKALLRKYAKSPAFIAGADHAITLVAAKIIAALDQDKSLKSLARRKPKARTLEALAAFSAPYDQAWTMRTSAVQLGCSSSELDQFARFLVNAEKRRGRRPPAFLPENLQGARNPLSRILHRFNTGHDHGLYTTVIEELFIALEVNKVAGGIWNEMKVLIDDSFKDDAQAGGTAFLNHLCELWQRKPTFRVTLIGHSAGSIYVQRFLEALDARLPGSSTARVEVTLVAGAITFERMYQGLPVWPRRVSGLRVFAMDDFREGNYWEIWFVYNKSLLYIVSGLCEVHPGADKPIVGMQRYWTRDTYKQEREIREVIETIGSTRSVWSLTPANAPPGYRSQAKRHGGFPEEKQTNQSVCYALQSGF